MPYLIRWRFKLFCFTFLVMLHILVILALGSTEKKPQSLYQEELSVLLDVIQEELPPAFLPVSPPVKPPASAALPEETPAKQREPAVSETSETTAEITTVAEETEYRHKPEFFNGNGESKTVETVGFSETGTAKSSGMKEEDYLTLILGRIEKHKIYPLSLRKRGIQGEVSMVFTIKRDGKAVSITASDTGILSQAAVKTIKAAEPFPVMEGSNSDYTMRVTLRYSLEE